MATFDITPNGPLGIEQVRAKMDSDKAQRVLDCEMMCGRFPGVSGQIRNYYNRVDEAAEVRFEMLKQGKTVDLEAVHEKQKREYWDFLTMIGNVDSSLPIVRLHDEFCAVLDNNLAVVRQYNARMEELTRLVNQSSYNMRLAIALKDPDEANEAYEEFVKLANEIP